MKRRLPLGACLKASVGFVPTAYAHAWGGLLVGAAPFALLMVRPVFEAINSYSVRPYQAALAIIGVSVAALVRDGGLYRLGVGRDVESARACGLGPAGLQLSSPEVRLLAAGALVSLFLLLIAVAGLVVSLFVASAAGLSNVDWATVSSSKAYLGLGEPWKMILVGAVAVGAIALLVGLGAKLSLYAAATVGRARVTSIDALGLADGNALKLLAGLIIVHAPTVALYAAGPFLTPVFMAGPIGDLLVIGLIQPPLTIGFLSAAYRALEYVKTEDIGGEVHG